MDAVSMEVAAWTSLYHAMNAQDDRRPFSRATLRRIGAFARPHRRKIVAFLALSVVIALFAVATPVLAGRVVDALVERQPIDHHRPVADISEVLLHAALLGAELEDRA